MARCRAFSLIRSLLPVALFGLLGVTNGVAESPDPAAPGVWGKSPETTDDRSSNPGNPRYLGPDGWFNSGEVRAVVSNAAHASYQYKGSFKVGPDGFVAVNDAQVLFFDFGGRRRPAPGEYAIAARGSTTDKTVRLIFVDLSDRQIRTWISRNGAGVLTVKLVNGFSCFTFRNVTLQPNHLPNTGDFVAPLVIGFEGALSPE